ncbi:MAG: histidine phosphatase family protein [Acidobacteria bacterium]|nr:histidine phosphatase family protein [Acidobacteriota bacterium]
MLILVHHGDAVGPDVDPTRPLSAAGRAAAARLATEAASRGVRPDVIWHSGKLRARQTAELFWRACNPLAGFSAEPGLQPDDPPARMRDRLAGESRSVVLVGHMPNLARLLHVLRGRPAGEPPDFPLHGCVALGADGDSWKELWRLI